MAMYMNARLTRAFFRIARGAELGRYSMRQPTLLSFRWRIGRRVVFAEFSVEVGEVDCSEAEVSYSSESLMA